MTESNGIDYKARCEHYEKVLRIKKNDVTIEGYKVFVNILSQQTKYLGEFILEEKIKAIEKSAEHIAYKNAKELWEKLPKLIQDVLTLRQDLGIVEPEVENKQIPISPQSVAGLNGK